MKQRSIILRWWLLVFFVFLAVTHRTQAQEAQELTLYDNREDNSTIIANNDGQTRNVTLSGRTIYSDGDWNTLCLPFDMSESQIASSPLVGYTIKSLDGTQSDLDSDGNLTLRFNTAETIEAGRPYIVKWPLGFTINNEQEWDTFVNNVAMGTTYEGQLVKLNADVSISAGGMVGRANPFMGIFDGGGHTITCNIDYTDHEWKVGNTHFSLPTSRTYMNPFASWVNPAYATPQMLQYFQTIFDYAELFRRQARDDEAADRFMQEMQEATDSGRDSASVQFFSKLVKEELAHTKDPVSDDLIIYPKGWGLGMHGGCEAGLFYGPATKYIDHSFGGGVGFDFAYGRVLLMCDLQRYMYGDLKQEFLHKGELFKAGEWMSGGSVELSLGYIAYDSQWWRVTPFVGAGAGYLSFPRGEDDCKRADDAYGFRALAGIYTDCKFWRQISVPEFTKEPLEEYSVRFKLYVAHTDFPTLGPAWSINFGIGISGIGWSLNR